MLFQTQVSEAQKYTHLEINYSGIPGFKQQQQQALWNVNGKILKLEVFKMHSSGLDMHYLLFWINFHSSWISHYEW